MTLEDIEEIRRVKARYCSYCDDSGPVPATSLIDMNLLLRNFEEVEHGGRRAAFLKHR